MIDERERSARGRQLGRVDVVLEDDRHAVKWTADAAGGALGIARAGIGDRAWIDREHRAERRAVAIVEREPGEILARDVFGGQPAGRHRVLQFGDALLEDRERRSRCSASGRRRQVPVGDLRALPRRQSAKIGSLHELRGDLGDARDLRSRRRNPGVGSGIHGLAGDQRILERNRIAAARIVDLAQSFHDERHQRARFAGTQAQREDVADVRGIESRPRIDERIAVHVADRRQHAGRPCPSTCAEGPWPDGPVRGIGDALRVLHHRDERIGQIDPPIAAGRGGDRDLAAVLVGASGAAPRDLDDALLGRACS